MNIIERLILITVAITVFQIIWLLYLLILFFILYPFFGKKTFFFPKVVSTGLHGLFSQIAAFLLPIVIFLYVFYIIMYIIYLIIIYIVPPTGWATLWIPIREILLGIEPMPSLIKYGVFKLFDNIIKAFGLSDKVKSLIIILGSLFDFSRENIKQILIQLLPMYRDKINEFASIENFNIDNENGLNKDIIEYKKICIAQNVKKITPDMNAVEKIQTNLDNIFETIKCESKSISNYIKQNK
jgi:hypothetical protein